ncbi:MAG: preprotein translocase subunit SecG [Lachnospiraceae bacterium]|nr:preprotein translocase subunit SecG [Lachnospiraceae bacterium]MBR6665161.1 preprotein translocase subunit SecG [Lachnospiraceae bacterium]
MAALRVILTILFIIVCIAIIVLVLLQEGKSAGLGALSGAAESYWGKNKARTMQGMLVKLTKIFGVLFMVLAIVLNLNVF